MSAGLLVKPYSVSVDGFMPITYYAASPGKARAKAFRDYSASFATCTFHRFLCLSSVRNGDPGEGYGEAILVEGEPAYRIPINEGHYVGFCRPGGDQVMRCHPRDVRVPLASARPTGAQDGNTIPRTSHPAAPHPGKQNAKSCT